MLSTEDNELLCRTDAGTPMGELFRRFWLPALLPRELPAPDCDPIRVRILGEDLIAFRDTNGQVGFLANNCPHRGASLFFGRNEEAGLRCVYHGWKFDVTGQCVDMPNEPAESNFKNKVRARAYPAAERGGLIWIYMGPAGKQPPLPEYQWTTQVDAPRARVNKWIQDSNYSHGLEGNIDSSHVAFLHSTLNQPMFQQSGNVSSSPQRMTALDTDFGYVYGARRDSPEGAYYWRITTFVLPSFANIASKSRWGEGFFLVPQDDQHHYWFGINPPTRPDLAQRPARNPGMLRELTDPTQGLIPGTFRHIRNKDNDYLIDREMQRTYNYAGMPAYSPVQDKCVTESMGELYDRTQERLGVADTAIIHWRRLMLRLVRQFQQGLEPAVLHEPSRFRAIPLDVVNGEPEFQRVWEAHHAEFRRGAGLASATP
jgi:phenylpropionate dioxygenase-like ring-hydroxylating dioxygenase large terminal subunit